MIMPRIYKIITYSISLQLETDLRKKSLSEEEVAHVYDVFSEKKKKQMTSVKIGFIVMAVFALIIGVATLLSVDNILFGFIYLFGTLALLCGAMYLAWYCNIGKISKQWNKLLKDYYPQICDKYVL